MKASEMPAAGTGGGLAGATWHRGPREGPRGRGEGKPPSALRSTGQNWGPSPPCSSSNWVLTCPGQGNETSSLSSPPASGGVFTSSSLANADLPEPACCWGWPRASALIALSNKPALPRQTGPSGSWTGVGSQVNADKPTKSGRE